MMIIQHLSHICVISTRMQCWDLKIGGVYIVLGKQCTVNQTDVPTTRWIRFHANRFIGIQKAITRELIKYKNRPADILSSPKASNQVRVAVLGVCSLESILMLSFILFSLISIHRFA